MLTPFSVMKNSRIKLNASVVAPRRVGRDGSVKAGRMWGRMATAATAVPTRSLT